MLREDSTVFSSKMPDVDRDLAVRLLRDETAVDAGRRTALENSLRRVWADDREHHTLSEFGSALG